METDNNKHIVKIFFIIMLLGLLMISILMLITPVKAVTIQQIKDTCIQSNLKNLYLPIGAYYWSVTPDNPRTTLGYGVWELQAVGQYNSTGGNVTDFIAKYGAI